MSIVYYRGPDVVITDECFVVRTPSARIFKLDELGAVFVVRGDRRPLRLAFGLAALLMAGGVIVFWAQTDSAGVHLTGLTLTAVPLVLACTPARWNPRTLELRAVHRNVEVTLFASTNETAFGQIRRGLGRALEGLARRGEAEESPRPAPVTLPGVVHQA